MTRPFEVLTGEDGSMSYDLLGNFGSEAAAVKRVEKTLLSLVPYGYAFRARYIVKGPGVTRRFRGRIKEGTPNGKPTYDPANWTVEEHEAEVVIVEVSADARSQADASAPR